MFWSFQSNKRQKMLETPELDYYLFVKKSDVVFVVEGKPILSHKSFLSEKSPVFSAMFSGNFKESKDKEIVIEDTTYEAFNAFIRFLYYDYLFVDIDNDFELIGELYRLSDRYDVSRLGDRIIYDLTDRNQLNGPISVSDKVFQKKWLKIRSITRIAFESQILRLIENVMTFIDINFDHFLKKDNKELSQLNDLTDGRLFELMANKFRKSKEDKKYRPITANRYRLPAKQLATAQHSYRQYFYPQMYATNHSLPQQFGYYSLDYGYGAGNPLQGAQAAAQFGNAAAIRQPQANDHFIPPPNSGQNYNAVNTFPLNINAIPFNPQQNYMPSPYQSYDFYNQMGGNTSRR